MVENDAYIPASVNMARGKGPQSWVRALLIVLADVVCRTIGPSSFAGLGLMVWRSQPYPIIPEQGSL